MLAPVLSFAPPVIARRGASARAPENTLAAFTAAHESGAAWIMAEVKLTQDGVPVLLGDDTLGRVAGVPEEVAEMTWAEIQKLDAGKCFSPAFKGARVSTLAELMAFAQGASMRINLELKPCRGRTQATAMVALIEAAKLWPETAMPPLISSADSEALVIAAQLHPDWPRGLVLEGWREDWRELAALTQASALHVDAKMLTEERMRLLRMSGRPILAYTVNDPLQAKELLREGITAVFSDNPALILKTLS